MVGPTAVGGLGHGNVRRVRRGPGLTQAQVGQGEQTEERLIAGVDPDGVERALDGLGLTTHPVQEPGARDQPVQALGAEGHGAVRTVQGAIQVAGQRERRGQRRPPVVVLVGALGLDGDEQLGGEIGTVRVDELSRAPNRGVTYSLLLLSTGPRAVMRATALTPPARAPRRRIVRGAGACGLLRLLYTARR